MANKIQAQDLPNVTLDTADYELVLALELMTNPVGFSGIALRST